MLTLIPIGGLANRLRSIASGVALARDYGQTLHIYWFKDAGLNCRFDDLCLPLDAPDIRLHEASALDALVYDRPRKRNARLPGVFQRLLFDGRLYEQGPWTADAPAFDFGGWMAQHRRTYISSCHSFYPADPALYGELFRPNETVGRLVDAYVARFTPHTVGVHIRRTDNAASIARSPLSLFIEEMEREVAAHADTLFFVASDSEEDKRALRAHFGDRILTSDRPADRSSLAGMQEGAVDFFTLSRTRRIIGSYYSSFSEVAALICGIPYHCTASRL